MRRNILFSLMMIGAVAALVSGATFSAFTGTANVTGSITAGKVTVGLGSETLSWTNCLTPTPTTSGLLGSANTCTSQVQVNYTGNLAATMVLKVEWTQSATTPANCFQVGASWSAGGSAGPSTTSPVQVTGLTAANGTATVTVAIASGLSQANLDACQNVGINLTLTVTTTETTG